MKNFNLILDFDSTFIQLEAIDELASISLRTHPKKEILLSSFQEKTQLGMEGSLPYSQSLKERILCLNAKKEHIGALVKTLQNKISSSILRNKPFFQTFSKNIYILSGGFIEYIWPIVKPFSILKKNVFANSFIFDYEENIIGYDENNFLAHDHGKTKLLDSLNLEGETIVIGDGYTDYEATLSKKNRKFFAFTENISRKNVIAKADCVLANFDEFLQAQNFISTKPSEIKNKKALLLENIHPSAAQIFTSNGFEVELLPNSLGEEELIQKLQNISVLGIRSKTNISQKVIEKTKDLLAIGTYCIGTDQVNLDACLKKGIAIFNAPYSNTRSVVELTIGHIIMLLRKIFEKSQKLHNGIWDKSASGSVEVRGKKLGIIGYGNIGSQLSVLAEALGMHVFYYDIVDKLPLGNAQKCNDLLEILEKVDVVSIHVNGCPENVGLIGEKELSKMKNSSVLINLSRGEVVDLKALAKCLKEKRIQGAAVDVYPKEPKSNKEPFSSELQGISNTILTPHIGGSTQEAQENISQFVTNSLLAYLQRGSSLPSVNFPQVRLPKMQYSHRLIHIHKNIPGILAQISKLLVKYNINVEGQFLKTNDQIGYVIIDTNSPYNPSLIEEIKEIPNTVRVRALY